MEPVSVDLPGVQSSEDSGPEKETHEWPNWELFVPTGARASQTSTGTRTSTSSTSTFEDDENGGGADGRGQRRGGGDGLQVKTVGLLAFVMCFGVCLVGLFGFFPNYRIGLRDVSTAAQLSQTQAIMSMEASASSSVHRLPNILKLILASQMSSCDHETPCVPRSASNFLFSAVNILSQPRYREFIAFIAGMHKGGGREWFVSVSTFFKSEFLGAILCRSLNATRDFYAIDSATHYLAEPRRVVLSGTGDVQNYVFQRGFASFLEDRAIVEHQERDPSFPTTIWAPFNISGWYIYFSAGVPLRSTSAVGSQLGFLEGSLRSVYLANVVHDHFRYAIRDHGCYMIVDPTRDVVIINSWGQLVRFISGHNSFYVPFSVRNVANPLMKVAIQFIRERRSLDGSLRRPIPTELTVLTFPFEGDTATVRVSSCSNAIGQELMLVSVVVSRDFFSGIHRTMRVLSFTMLLSAFLTICASYYVAVHLRTAIDQLTAALKASSKLQFTEGLARGTAPQFRITELAAVEVAYARLQQHLMTLKTAIPGPLLVAEDDELSDTDSGLPGASSAAIDGDNRKKRGSDSSTDATRKSLKESGSTSAAGTKDVHVSNDSSLVAMYISSTTKPASESLSRRLRRNVFLNTKIFNEKLNQFRKRYCTTVLVSRPYTIEVNEALLEDYFKVLYATAAEFRGGLQVLRPEYAVVTFNAFTSLPLHAKLACDFALALQRRMRPENARLMNVQVDTNNFLVGTCGSENGHKSRVVFDMIHFMQFSMVLGERALQRVVVTQPTAKHLEFYETIPLEVVAVPFQEAPYTLYELRDASGKNVAQMQRTAELFRTGFQYMRMGDYVKALKAYSSVEPADPTAQHFIEICVQRVREGSTAHYKSRSGDPLMRIFARAAHTHNCKAYLQFSLRYMEKAQKNGLFTPGPVDARSLIDNRAVNLLARRPGASAEASGENVESLYTSSTMRLREREDAHVHDDAMEGSIPPNNTSARSNEGGLIEWIDFNSQSQSADGEGEPSPDVGSPAVVIDAIPLSILDGNGQRWNRALRPEHSGPSSIVYQAIAEDGLQAAIKFLPKKHRNIPEARLHHEVNVMSNLKHLNIVQYISSTWTETHIGIIMEYAPGGSLRGMISRFGVLPESLVRRYMVDILHGLACLHRGGITHGDVKPHNILLGADGVCKLSDFGSTVSEAADLARSNGMLEFRGTAVYTSPEVAAGHLPTAASDIYSLGISFLEMLIGRLPWRWRTRKLREKFGDCVGLREVAFVQSVGLCDIVPMIPRHLPSAAQEFAAACCRVVPAERPSANDLLSFRFVL